MNRDPENRARTVLVRGRRGRPPLVLDAAPGQAIVLIVLLIVILLGFLALGLDGGGLFLLKRQAQNAADAAALAAAFARCADGDPTSVQTAGRNAATLNNFTDAPPEVQVILNNPYNGDDNLVEALVTAEKPAYFVQLVYKGPLYVTGRAVAECHEVFDPYDVNAIMALASCDECTPKTNTFDWDGQSGQITGGTLSNCDCSFQSDAVLVGGLECYNRLEDDPPSTCVDYLNGGANLECCSAPYDGETCTYLPPAPPSEPADDPLASLYFMSLYDDPTVVGSYAYQALNDTTCIQDNVDSDGGSNDCYHKIVGGLNVNGNGKIFEGLYYVEGNVRINNTLVVGDRGLTLVVKSNMMAHPPNGTVDILTSTGGIVHFIAYTEDNLLIYADFESDSCTSSDIHINGPATTWTGVIYGPHATCGWEAAEGTGYGAIVCKTIDLSGNRFDLTYDPSIFPSSPPTIGFVED